MEIWGSPEAIQEAKDDLYKLGQFALQNTNLRNPNTKEKKFAKTKAAPTEIQAERKAKSQFIEAKTKHYTELPEDLDAFPVMVSCLMLSSALSYSLSPGSF